MSAGLFDSLPAVRPPGFEELWLCWPAGRKVGEEAARKAYLRAIKEGVSHQFLVDRATVYAESVKHTERRFVLHLSTWINGKRYNDILEQQARLNGQSTFAAHGRNRGEERQDAIRRYHAATMGRSSSRGD